MRTLLFLASVLVVVCLSYSTPINPQRWLINRPTEEPYQRARRSPQNVKGGEAPIKGIGRVPLTRTQPTLRKGEYICGTKICRLQPGEVPKGCQGICQYNVALHKLPNK